MPELPEVETVKNVLTPLLIGAIVTDVTVVKESVIATPLKSFKDELVGSRFLDVKRRGKYLIFVTDKRYLTVHLRMTGSLLSAPPSFPMLPHTHVVIRLSNGRELRFTDPRRFGRLWLSDRPGGITAGLGPEPFEDGFDGVYLRKNFGGKRSAVKSALMDQGLVAGIGNIYADESCFAAGILPFRAAGSLDEGECARLAAAVKAVLTGAIDSLRVDEESYLAAKGRPYGNAYLDVYGRADKRCRRCDGVVERTTIAGRSSYYCPDCQR